MKTNIVDILEPYELVKKKIKDYETFILYQICGIKSGEEKVYIKFVNGNRREKYDKSRMARRKKKRNWWI